MPRRLRRKACGNCRHWNFKASIGKNTPAESWGECLHLPMHESVKPTHYPLSEYTPEQMRAIREEITLRVREDFCCRFHERRVKAK